MDLRIKANTERRNLLEASLKEAQSILSQRKSVKNDLEAIVARAQDMGEFLNESELSERKALAEALVREIVVMPGKAVVRYTIPISQSTQETELLLGGRSEEIRVGNEAEASSQLVWDVDGRLHPEEQPCAELWPSQQFSSRLTSFLQSLPQLQP